MLYSVSLALSEKLEFEGVTCEPVSSSLSVSLPMEAVEAEQTDLLFKLSGDNERLDDVVVEIDAALGKEGTVILMQGPPHRPRRALFKSKELELLSPFDSSSELVQTEVVLSGLLPVCLADLARNDIADI
jgi:hypothetical protein